MAFPALGLAKIVWAVDIILAMDLPEFRAAGLGAEPHEPLWHDVMAVSDLAPGATARVECDGRGLFVHHGAQGWQVFDSLCPHQTTNIPHLALQGHDVDLPETRMGVRRFDRSMHRQGRQPAETLGSEGRQRTLVRALVSRARPYSIRGIRHTPLRQ